jgi:Ser/Thr protein kinase RdoA (MazF antagonist)
MASVFSTNPPYFSIQDIEKYLLINFDLSGKVMNLYSDRDQNFLIQSESNQKFILKISNPAEQPEILELQNKATLYIRSREPNLGIPLQIGEIKEFNKDRKTYLVRLLEYLDGQFLKDSLGGNDAHEKLGVFLGTLSHSLAGFFHSAADRQFEWDVRATELIKSRLDYLKSESDKKTVTHFLNEYENNVLPIAIELKMAVIHNDGNDHNILVDEKGETTGIIDFGDMVYSYQIAEPAVCMAYLGLEKEDAFTPMAQVLKGYHSCFSLNNSELKSIIYLVCIRLCISVTMSAWRMKLFPENKYLSISQKPAWDLLRKLENEYLGKLTDRLTENLFS